MFMKSHAATVLISVSPKPHYKVDHCVKAIAAETSGLLYSLKSKRSRGADSFHWWLCIVPARWIHSS